jgi:hypothetical protein
MDGVIYQPSDLAGAKRVVFLEAARAGRARLRDKDGTSLVMLPEHDLDVLERYAHWSRLGTQLDVLLSSGRSVSVSELGELGWLRVFDSDDLREFVSELNTTLLASLADNDVALVEQVIRDWQVTARQLEDPLRRAVLTGRHDSSDFEDARQPAES